jgi:hypothetical protein
VPDLTFVGVTPNPLNVTVGNPGDPARAAPVIEYTFDESVDDVDPLFTPVWMVDINELAVDHDV